MQYDTTMTGEFFEGWFEKILLPVLPEDAVIVMDNASFHRKKQLDEIAGNNNITLIFLPPYSPELNPIEKVWANMKKFLRNFLHNFSSLDDAIYSFFQVEWLYYTTDGSKPVTSSTRKEYTCHVTITDRKNDANILSAVDPVLFDCAYSSYNQSECNAPADNETDKATVIKAAGTDASGNYSDVVTNTYFTGSMADHIQGIKESCKAAGIPLAIMSV